MERTQLVTQSTLICGTGMQGLLKGQVEVHRARGRAVGDPPGLFGQILKLAMGLRVNSTRGRATGPTTGGPKKVLLIDRLVRSTVLQSAGPIRGQQQERLCGTIRLHRRRQQIGHSGPRGGDNSHGSTGGSRQPQCQKGCGTFIQRGGELERPLISQQTRCCGQRS